jgi:hypothetical protein
MHKQVVQVQPEPFSCCITVGTKIRIGIVVITTSAHHKQSHIQQLQGGVRNVGADLPSSAMSILTMQYIL